MDLIQTVWLVAQIYGALLIVIVLHELGHIPEKIKIKLGIIPNAVAIRASSRIGGLLVNILLFSAIFYFKPESLFLNLIGIIALTHFVLYSVLGSILPEANPNKVNIKTYVFDDVPNEHGAWFIITSTIAIIITGPYYFELLKVMFI